MLDDDPLDDVGHILAHVNGRLEECVDILPPDDLDRIPAAAEEVGDRGARESIAFVLQPMNLDPVLFQPAKALQVAERLVDLHALLDDDGGHLNRDRRRLGDPVEHEHVGHLFDVIEDVVEARDQGMDVLAVERRDKRALEAMPDVMTDLVAAMLGVANLTGALLDEVVLAEHRLEQASRAQDVRSIVDEQLEEPDIAGDEAQAQWDLHRWVERAPPAYRDGPRCAILARHPRVGKDLPSVVDHLHVATLNIRNLADRWDERLPLLLADMAALQPDLMGLQEVVYPLQQDRLLGAAGEARYDAIRGWAGRPEYGNSLLVREPLAASVPERIDLGLRRAAHRVIITSAAGSRVLMTVTHLHDPGAEEAARDDQARALLAWLDAAPPSDVQVVVGDFNADPAEPTYDRMVGAGFRSAYVEANGAEPAVTWPTGIQGPMIDTGGSPECLDYIWVRGAATSKSCRLVFDRPAVGDPTLYPSDHIGVSAHLELG